MVLAREREDLIAVAEAEGGVGRRLQLVPEQIVLGPEQAGFVGVQLLVLRVELPGGDRRPEDDARALGLLPQRWPAGGLRVGGRGDAGHGSDESGGGRAGGAEQDRPAADAASRHICRRLLGKIG